VLSPVFWTEASAGEHENERIALLQLRERAALAAVVRKLVVGKDRAGNDVGPHLRPPYLLLSSVRSMLTSFGSPAASPVTYGDA
jgi:hypothetical protein